MIEQDHTWNVSIGDDDCDIRRQRPVATRQIAQAVPIARIADPDSDLIALIAAGDLEGALRGLMRRHGAAMYRYGCVALRDDALAEDVQQQVFIEAYRDLPRFGGRATLRTWLFAILRHRVLDAARVRSRTEAHLEATPAADVADPLPPAGELLDDAQLREALVACLDELDEPIRTALLLRFQQGFTFPEMAVICGEQAGTLQARVARALPVLRAAIRRRTGRDV